MEEQFLQRLTNAVDAHLDDEHFGVTELAAELGMSRTTLHRKVRQVVKKSVSAFIRETRLKKAFGLLQNNDGTVAEIAYKVGFGSATYFNKCFHDFYGFPPGDVLKGNHQLQQTTESINPGKKKRLLPVILFFFTIILAVSLYYILNNNKSSIIIYSIPTNQENSTLMLKGFQEEVQKQLIHFKELHVISGAYFKYLQDSVTNEIQIAKKLKSKYLLLFEGQTTGGKTIFWLKLIRISSGKTLWNDTFEYKDGYENLGRHQREVTLTVAKKLNVNIRSEERQQIEKMITDNLAAFNLYNKGIAESELGKFERHSVRWKKAKKLFEEALRLDPNFADAWLSLAGIYASNSIWQEMKSGFLYVQIFNNKLDTVIRYLEKAEILEVTDRNKFLFKKSIYLRNTGDFKKSFRLLEKSWESKVKDFTYYLDLSNFYFFKCDYYNCVRSSLKYRELVPKMETTPIHVIDKLTGVLINTGFHKEAINNAKIRFSHDNDTTAYKSSLIKCKLSGQNYESAYDDIQKQYLSDTTNLSFIWKQMNISIWRRDYSNAFYFMQKHTNLQKQQNILKTPRIEKGYLYQLNGNEAEANWHFNGLLANSIALGDTVVVPKVSEPYIFHELASVYSILGKKEEAFKCLNRIAQLETIPRYAINNLNLPFYDTIRNEPEFKRIKGEMQRKYENEHKRIRELLLSKGIDPS